MKTITLFIAAAIFSFVLQAQTTLIYNTDNIINTGNSFNCPGGDNFHARYFLLDTDFGITNEFTITDGEIGVEIIDAGGVDVVVNVIAADASFPTGYPGAGTLLGSEAVNIPGFFNLSIFNVTFTPPVVVPAGTQFLIVEVVQQLTGITFLIGGTVAETADSWIASVQCALPEYGTTTSLGFPDAHYYITVTGDEILGVGDNLSEFVSIYPNPASDVLNIKLPSNIEIISSNLYDILGKDTGVRLINGTINISNLARGVYILNIKTSAGTLIRKIIKN